MAYVGWLVDQKASVEFPPLLGQNILFCRYLTPSFNICLFNLCTPVKLFLWGCFPLHASTHMNLQLSQVVTCLLFLQNKTEASLNVKTQILGHHDATNMQKLENYRQQRTGKILIQQ